MFASDFRAIARRSLSGKWFPAVLAGLAAWILGGGSDRPIGVDVNLTTQSASLQVANFNIPIYGYTVLAWLSTAVLAGLAIALLLSVLGSVIEVGYARFNLDLVDGNDAQPQALFAYFSIFWTAFCTRFLKWLYTLLWGLLFIIPGIMASYSYSMTSYILAEHPEMTASEAIARSKELMRGNRWRLFCLHFSFIGWSILCSLTFGIGVLFLNPYRAAADAAFYRDLTGSGNSRPDFMDF